MIFENFKEIPSKLFYIKLKRLQGDFFDWNTCKGKKILVVNTASECGFTKQYKELQSLYEQHDDVLEIIGVACNHFRKQEPGNADDINSFCKLNFGVIFPQSEKLDVKGDNERASYAWLTDKNYNGVKNSSVKRNFQKYLIDDEGHVIDYYLSITKPKSRKILKHLDLV